MMKNVVTMKLLQRFLANALPPAALHAILRLLGVPSCSPPGRTMQPRVVKFNAPAGAVAAAYRAAHSGCV
jgi:hypothetical protein